MTVNELLWPDQLGEHPFDRAVRRLASKACAAGFTPRVEDAEADAVVDEYDACIAVERERDQALGSADDRANPGEVDLGVGVADGKAQGEAVLPGIEVVVRHDPGNRVPVLVAHCSVDPAYELDPAESHVPQVDAMEHHLQRDLPGAARVPRSASGRRAARGVADGGGMRSSSLHTNC